MALEQRETLGVAATGGAALGAAIAVTAISSAALSPILGAVVGGIAGALLGEGIYKRSSATQPKTPAPTE